MGEAVATTVAPVAEDAPTIKITLDVEAATVTEKSVVEETAAMPGVHAIEGTVTVAGTLTEEKPPAIIDMVGPAVVILLFVCFGLAHKVMKERRGFVAYLFSQWALLWREVDRGKIRTPLDVLQLIAEGDGTERNPLEGSKGQKSLLPAKRREAVDEMLGLERMQNLKFMPHVSIDGTAAHVSFYASKEELDENQEEWMKLGDLIEKNRGALFTDEYWDNEQYLYFFEVVFSDERRRAKSKAVPINPREYGDAAKWFWGGLFPILILSLFIVHWAIWAIILSGGLFVYIRDLGEKKQIAKVADQKAESGYK